MALIVEDGSGVPGANSYVTLEEARAFAESRGISFPTVDADLEVLLVNGFDFIESFSSRFQGMRTVASQATTWPRSGVVVDGYYLDKATIPQNVKLAQIRAAEATLEMDLMPMPSAGVVKEKIDVLEVQYDSPMPTGQVLEVPKVMMYLDPLFYRGGGFRVRVVRG